MLSTGDCDQTDTHGLTSQVGVGAPARAMSGATWCGVSLGLDLCVALRRRKANLLLLLLLLLCAGENVLPSLAFSFLALPSDVKAALTGRPRVPSRCRKREQNILVPWHISLFA